MAAAGSLARKLLLQLEGNASTHHLSAMGVAAGFFSAAAVTSAASDEGAAACPAYPWPQDGAQGGRKVFMQSDCAACHSMLPYAGLRNAAPAGEVQAKVAEILVVNEEHRRRRGHSTRSALAPTRPSSPK
ncbi:hypothetical protein EJB05_19231 [Eragrostis curvula]|uniref:Cytochrome c domain-containing protein n=1 Tax=Eragrostis curvula TaxID=38414 RepID=A0A5J9UWQ9_9POAL|nr:hypothetical protein EJB05_19231 [Eragrostis curvula]